MDGKFSKYSETILFHIRHFPFHSFTLQLLYHGNKKGTAQTEQFSRNFYGSLLFKSVKLSLSVRNRVVTIQHQIALLLLRVMSQWKNDSTDARTRKLVELYIEQIQLTLFLYPGWQHYCLIKVFSSRSRESRGLRNDGHEKDSIWLQWWWQSEPNMIAICFTNRAIYDCNLFRPNMIAMSKIIVESRDNDFWTNLAKTNFPRLKLYLVPFETNCNHIWFALNF